MPSNLYEYIINGNEVIDDFDNVDPDEANNGDYRTGKGIA
jgi:hypothetical protein